MFCFWVLAGRGVCRSDSQGLCFCVGLLYSSCVCRMQAVDSGFILRLLIQEGLFGRLLCGFFGIVFVLVLKVSCFRISVGWLFLIFVRREIFEGFSLLFLYVGGSFRGRRWFSRCFRRMEAFCRYLLNFQRSQFRVWLKILFGRGTWLWVCFVVWGEVFLVIVVFCFLFFGFLLQGDFGDGDFWEYVVVFVRWEDSVIGRGS